VSARTVVDGRYELDPFPVGRGGMGEVWFGRDRTLDRDVAVKFLRFPDGDRDDELVRRFLRESRITARLEHPGVPAVYDVGTHEGRPYLVMQRVNGISVADLIAEQGPLPIGWAAAIAAQTCAVLTAAHRASLVHRDLKPVNLLLQPDGAVKVLDFGLAVGADLADFSRITRTGQSFGTPAYMAPEQILSATSSPRTDLYALGCTLHEMLTGTPPFRGASAYAVMSQQVDEAPRPVQALRPDVPDEVAALLDALLQKEPARRPPDAASVYDTLLPFAGYRPPLPGVLDPGSVAHPMYAEALGRCGPSTRHVREESGDDPDAPAARRRTSVPVRGGQPCPFLVTTRGSAERGLRVGAHRPLGALIGPRLQGVQVGVEAAGVHQLGVGAVLDHLPA